MLDHAVGRKLLETFKGREEFIAYCPPDGHFDAYEVSADGIPVESFCRKHADGGSCGLYVLRADSTVWLAAVDFDDHEKNPQAIKDAQKFGLFMREQGYPCYLEQSQSGSGGHVWFFFDSPLPAGEVRVFLRGALADIDMGVEVYPKQAKLAGADSLGNLIRYPLSNQSCFLDLETLEPQEPLAFMQGIQQISRDSLMRKAWWEGQDRVVADQHGYDTDGLPARVASLLEGNSLLLKRWHQDTTGMQGDGSNSSILFAIAVELVRSYVPTPEIEAALRYVCRLWGYDKGLRIAELTACKAYQQIVPKPLPEVLDLSDETSRMSVKMHQALQGLQAAPTKYHTLGIRTIDESLEGGVAPGELTVIAGWPGHGKTTWMYQGLLNTAKQGVSGLFISLEMTIRELTAKHLCRLTDIPKSEWGLPEHAEELHKVLDRDLSLCAPIHFLRGGGPNGDDNSLSAIVAAINRAADDGVECVVIDYLGAIAGCDDNKNGDIARAVTTLNQLARKRSLDIRLVSQLRRPDDKLKTFKMPTLFDMSGSTHIEQKADNVLAIAWPYKFDEVKYAEGLVSIAKLKCKNRSSGGTLVFPIPFDAVHQTYHDSVQFGGE